MDDHLLATATIDIDALADDVWFALTDPAATARYLFGTRVDTDWRVGSPITWSGVIDGERYEDHGEVLEAAPGRLLRYVHVSSARGDTPEAAHEVTIALQGVDGNLTRVTLTQDGNRSLDARRHSARTWNTVLQGLKLLVEQRRPSP